MTQAQLATAINEKGSVINEYETGKAIPKRCNHQQAKPLFGRPPPKGEVRTCDRHKQQTLLQPMLPLLCLLFVVLHDAAPCSGHPHVAVLVPSLQGHWVMDSSLCCCRCLHC